jgi:predicted AlkP superfamily pyrophosphatase or phosphodiesterase
MKNALATLCLALLLTPAAAAAGIAAEARHVVLISVDGMGNDLLLHADELGLKIPHMRRLMREGTLAEGALSVVPSVTFTAHTTMITGVDPVRHGVVNNTIFDPGSVKGAGLYIFAEDVTARTLFDAAAAKGLDSAAVWWPVTGGAPIGFNLPDISANNLKEARTLLHLSSPAVREVIGAPESVLGIGGENDVQDGLRTKVAIAALARKPHLLAVHFTELDGAEHFHGPRSKEAVEVLEKTDGYIGEILSAVEKAGIQGATTVLVTSDHGFQPVEKVVRIGSLFANLGLIEMKDGRLVSWRAFPWSAGGSLAVYIAPGAPDGTTALVDQVLGILSSRPDYGVRQVYRGADLEKLGGYPGAYTVLDAAPGFTFSSRLEGPLLEPTDERGDHGQMPDRPGLAASLIVQGPGIKKGNRIGMVRLHDIAPTLARILGLDLGPVDGRVLEEIFR